MRLIERLEATRAYSVALAVPLTPEDCQAQSMPDASPVKWHLAHVTWFLETLVLERHEPGFRAWNPAYRMMFNSYYHAVGDKHPRPARGLLTRPGLQEVLAWRADVDRRLVHLLEGACTPELVWLIELGIQHEQQHQELLLTDVKHLLSCNPLRPPYAPGRRDDPAADAAVAPGVDWIEGPAGLVEVGAITAAGFHFDNEAPRHAVFLRPYALAEGLVSNADWLAFIDAGGYAEPRWWLDAGWSWRTENGIDAPLYWESTALPDGTVEWWQFTLAGLQPLPRGEAVVHVSFYEADAYCRWRAATDPSCQGARLPTEFEWEAACGLGLADLHGRAWQWTASSYSPYPGFAPWNGAVGEYNGKFMVNQMVLRGSSCATPDGHARASYRNFFPPGARWQFSGLRLARDTPAADPR